MGGSEHNKYKVKNMKEEDDNNICNEEKEENS